MGNGKVSFRVAPIWGTMGTKLSRASRAAFTPALLVLFTLACDREPGILVNIAAWPDGGERLRGRTTIEGIEGTATFASTARALLLP